jgi:hypothetical protein
MFEAWEGDEIRKEWMYYSPSTSEKCNVFIPSPLSPLLLLYYVIQEKGERVIERERERESDA